MKQQKQLQVCSALCYSHYSLLGKNYWMQGALLPHRFLNWVLEALETPCIPGNSCNPYPSAFLWETGLAMGTGSCPQSQVLLWKCRIHLEMWIKFAVEEHHSLPKEQWALGRTPGIALIFHTQFKGEFHTKKKSQIPLRSSSRFLKSMMECDIFQPGF